ARVARGAETQGVSELDISEQIHPDPNFRLSRQGKRIDQNLEADPGANQEVAPAAENHLAGRQLSAGDGPSSIDASERVVVACVPQEKDWVIGCVLRRLLPLVAHSRVSGPAVRAIVHDEPLLEDLLERKNVWPSRSPAERHIRTARRIRVRP